jgi:glycosyltransferase involved in cell wall biosynthesis
VVFDFLATRRALDEPGELLTLGYNTALFGALFRLRGRRNVINMDGMEWRRAKWSVPVKLWFYLNERLACLLGDELIADHPEIAAHLATRTAASRIAMVPYGADEIEHADAAALERFGVQANDFALLIARPEPENSVLELVRAFSSRQRPIRLVVLGHYDARTSAYHRRVLAAASGQVSFPGAVYDGTALAALRLHCRFYLHGHQVGGTNPSLVEALGAGCAVLAHDNPYNRWVAGQGARFFRDEAQCASQMDLLAGRESVVDALRIGSRARFRQAFRWEPILQKYERLLQPRPAAAAESFPSPASSQT